MLRRQTEGCLREPEEEMFAKSEVEETSSGESFGLEGSVWESWIQGLSGFRDSKAPSPHPRRQ